MTLTSHCGTFKITKLLKTTKPNKHFGVLKFMTYSPDKSLCVVSCIDEHLKQTMSLRSGCKSLLISYIKLHCAVSTNTISRWLKEVLKLSGIDSSSFKAHSIRSAVSSAAKASNVPIEQIMAAAGWSNSQTFRKFYDKPYIY